MKRIVYSVLTGAMVLSMTACSGGGTDGTVSVSLSEPYSMAAEFTCGELAGTAALSYLGDDAWEAEFSAPDSLAGVKLAFLDGNVTASYKGLTFSVPQTAIPVKTSLGQLFDVLEDAAEDGTVSCKIKDDSCVIEDAVDAGEYTLTLDKNGTPLSFAMPNQNLEMTFSGFSGGAAQTTAAAGATTAESTETTETTVETSETAAQAE